MMTQRRLRLLLAYFLFLTFFTHSLLLAQAPPNPPNLPPVAVLVRHLDLMSM